MGIFESRKHGKESTELRPVVIFTAQVDQPLLLQLHQMLHTLLGSSAHGIIRAAHIPFKSSHSREGDEESTAMFTQCSDQRLCCRKEALRCDDAVVKEDAAVRREGMVIPLCQPVAFTVLCIYIERRRECVEPPLCE